MTQENSVLAFRGLLKKDTRKKRKKRPMIEQKTMTRTTIKAEAGVEEEEGAAAPQAKKINQKMMIKAMKELLTISGISHIKRKCTKGKPSRFSPS